MWHFCNFTQPDGTHLMPCLINLTSWACALPLSLSLIFFFPLQTHSSHLLSSLDLHKSITHRHMSITCHLHKLITLCHHKHHRTSKLKCQKHKSDPFTRLGHTARSRHLHRPITHRHHEHYNITKLENSIQALWILAGFGFVFWKSNRAEGVKGEMSSEENGEE